VAQAIALARSAACHGSSTCQRTASPIRHFGTVQSKPSINPYRFRNCGSPSSTAGEIGPWIHAPNPSVSAQHEILQQQVGLYRSPHSPHRAERQLDVRVEEAITYPALSGNSVEVAVVDNGRPRASRLRKQVHHAVDVLMQKVNNRQQDGCARQIGQKAVGIQIGREVAVPIGYVDAMVEEAHLGVPSSGQKLVSVEEGSAVGRRRQFTQKVGAAVADEEERRTVRVIGAACRASGHREIGLAMIGVPLLSAKGRSGIVRAGASSNADEHGLFELGEQRARLGRHIAHRAGPTANCRG
jgi:hypothetical protein